MPRLEGEKSTWPWVLAALALLVILGLVLLPRLRNDKVANDTANQTQQTVKDVTPEVAQTTKSAFTSVKDFLAGTKDRAADSVDRTIDFNNVTVKSVGTNDMVFWVNNQEATDPGQRQGQDIFVYMSPQVRNQLTAGTTIKDGMHLNITGVVKALPSVDEIKTQWKLNDDDANYLKNKALYIDATTLQVQ